MGFLSPWFFTGVLALGVPVFVHLLRKHVTVPRPVSSLMFFERGIQSSTRHRRLRYLLLFILRSSLLFLIVLAFADPILQRSSGPDGRLLLLVLDNSFSMHVGSRFEDAKKEAFSIVSMKPAMQQGQVIALGSRLQILTEPTNDTKQLHAAIEAIKLEEGHANFGEFGHAIRSMMQAGEPVDLHLFSDMQRTAMPAAFVDMSLPEQVKLILHDVSKTTVLPNWTVESVDAPSELADPKDPKRSRAKAMIAGFNTPAAEKTVSLLSNGKIIASTKVKLEANGRAMAEFAPLDIGYGFNRCEVRIIESDAFSQDNDSLFVIHRSDPQRVLFVHQDGDSRSPLYFGSALGAATGDAFVVQSVNEKGATDLNPEKYAFVVLSDTSNLPSLFEHSLEQYVSNGGNVFVSLSTGARQHSHIPLWGGSVAAIRSYVGNETPLKIGKLDFTHPALEQAQPKSGDDGWNDVRILYAAVVNPVQARVIAALTDGTPLLLDKRIANGHVLLLTSGLENLSNDLPLHPIFVAFVDRIARYLSGDEQRSGARIVDSFLRLRSESSGKGETGSVEVIDPEGERPLSLKEAQSAQNIRLEKLGFYQIRYASGRSAVVGVNPDRRESDLQPMPKDVQDLWAGNSRTSPLSNSKSIQRDMKNRSSTLWWYVILLALVVALAEFFLASDYMAVQREET